MGLHGGGEAVRWKQEVKSQSRGWCNREDEKIEEGRSDGFNEMRRNTEKFVLHFNLSRKLFCATSVIHLSLELENWRILGLELIQTQQ
jgi:hypothetical protein